MFKQGCGIAFGHFGVRNSPVALENTELENSIARVGSQYLWVNIWDHVKTHVFPSGKIFLGKSGQRDSFGKDECLLFRVSGLFISNTWKC